MINITLIRTIRITVPLIKTVYSNNLNNYKL